MSCNFSRPLRRAVTSALSAYRPPPRLLVSEWAGKHRHLSPEASAVHGQWRNARALHLVQPMDCLSPYHPAVRVVCKFASQTGKTEVILNFIGYIIDCDPGPILAMQPNVSPMGEAFSKDRIAPMIRDSPTLRAKIGDTKTRSSASTITHKSFPQGHLSIVGANSAAGLASRPIRYLLGDEVDRWEATKEGDPLFLARKRQQTFRVRGESKELLVSSPTYADLGICVEYDKCAQQWEMHLPCMHCGETQRPQLKHFDWDDGAPSSVRYVCESCGAEHSLDTADALKARGRWVCVKDEGPESVGFWMSQWVSPFARWDDTIAEWLSAGNDGMQQQAVTNTAFAEPWEGEGERGDAHALEAREEDYAAPAPAAVRAITLGIDVQHDRLEIEVVGWGEGETSWSLDYEVIIGEPTSDELWADLREYLKHTWQHESGTKLSPVVICIDSGNWSKNVYAFVKQQRDRRIIPIKGASPFGADALSGTRKDRLRKVAERMRNGRPAEIIGVSQIKRIIAKRLAIPLESPGCCHFPKGRGREYYDQLTGERLVATKKRGQRAKLAWVKVHPNVEALDCRVYAYAGLLLAEPDLSVVQSFPAARNKVEGKKKIKIGPSLHGEIR